MNMKTKACQYCKKEFERPKNVSRKRWRKRKYCSRECYRRDKSFITNCTFCGKELTLPNSRKTESGHYFCDLSCHAKYKFSGDNHPRWNGEGSIEIECSQCGKEIERKRWHVEGSEHLFCSRDCYAKWQSENGGGENHWNWQGGVSRENHRRETPEYIEWREEVYKRDHFTCQDCDKHCGSNNIVAHHIKSYAEYPELRFDIDNGVTLCRSCHKKRHKKIGYLTRFGQKTRIKALN